MNDFWINILALIAGFVGMEGIAWFSHKYLMHGVLWYLHRDHHQRNRKRGFFEKNDWFFLIFAFPSFIFILTGLLYQFNFFFWIGMGFTLYGITYLLVHDLFIHQRFPFRKKTRSAYLRALRKAHHMHHKHLQKENGECFGMLWVPLKYFREAKNSHQS